MMPVRFQPHTWEALPALVQCGKSCIISAFRAGLVLRGYNIHHSMGEQLMRNSILALSLAAALALAACGKKEAPPSAEPAPAPEAAAPAPEAAAPATDAAAPAAAAGESCSTDCGDGTKAETTCAAGEKAVCDCAATPKAKCEPAAAAPAAAPAQ
jgi:hypothetical protein